MLDDAACSWLHDDAAMGFGPPGASIYRADGYVSGDVQGAGSDDEDEEEEPTTRRVGADSSHRPSRRRGLGIAESRESHCPRCSPDLNPPELGDDPLRDGAPVCMADDMMQQNRVVTVIQKQHQRRATRRSRRRPDDDPDRRGARFAVYRAVVAWLWSNPLGAEQRVRLPPCVVQRVRREFPNPACSVAEGCDYGPACERRGHYTGFRTADESRARREGTFVNFASSSVDLRSVV